MKAVRQLFYRGSLDFCNYSCGYCPFSKKKGNRRVLERDRMEWLRFVRHMEKSGFCGAVQVVPYGEALVHGYYWEGLAALSRCGGIQAVGAQSNFSFPVGKMLDIFDGSGGRRDKLRLWGTFHPDMAAMEDFLAQCRYLQEKGILFCVGSVGVPDKIGTLRGLREELGDGIYLWINKMDGLGRRYTEEEIRSFMAIDPYFELELRLFQADGQNCQDSLLIEGNGNIRPCILCHHKMGNLYQDGLAEVPEKKCTGRVCSCFLSYSNRTDIPELLSFQPFPAFRIPDGFRK